ncbi:tRNA (adenosine(37)-N6)-dimethylallyltransferase MiaA [Streptococcus gallolyticus subsp. gallolyticus]|uniref:tRNA (adenosine(37)-N6)-dimethylallyltransferase MiaA n=1 Tax=Streptococcus gallolyticus TaxID=315405 RepID=UPI002000BDBB|nr:tRNA (adenosine(37)-N6)-dimethylallyltransferase MiaA [Streptococcus gallolyticus]MCY7155562.1 tRNA (adenosine(37)-N6)-dimethylallyltransferase MiaA [Streptococcus gallolyticus subsp. gallolyticus]MCY7174317.1 tRNA (adenosine(37)-N6)-dimethylallyltransferase MiaA [Streptococcus gallolyticus subsp. gallolyticus]MCY7176437.1 tRNA (adenosine(37)-N6)-dimethylallyltransferase MiaA [Streptococcus gallolyticus subsp. gallolyticus]MCY7180891.1 tRNA (adenosine(37)-N6)-dimethylallyltransferase MiaA [S
MSEKIKLIAVVGPTAVGKTALGIELAQQFNGEIISGDSQQVYRHLDIGTAKATPEEQAAAPHHLIDVRDVDANYSAYDFVVEASQAITEIASRGKVPIIVGGTGLYLQSLLEGYHLGGEVDQEKVLAYRKTLEQLSDEVLFGKIAELGKEIPEINRRRAIRALELAKFGQNLENKETNYEVLLIGLNDDRQVLYDRINHRVDLMLEKGILDEAKWLYDNHRNAQAARAIGYKELFPYFTGDASLEDCVEKLKQNTRRFAKRQLTWFRNRMAVNFYTVSEADFKETVIQDVNEFLK